MDKIAPSRPALHEAAHAVALLANGIPVDLLSIGGEDGSCTPARDPADPEVVILVSLVGAEAEALADGIPGQWSWADATLAYAAEIPLGRLNRKQRLDRLRAAREFVSDHEAEIRHLAEVLDRQLTLTGDALAGLCDDPPLSKYRRLYSDPPARRLRKRG